MKVLIRNRTAKFNYEIVEKYNAGIVLAGHEVKAIKMGQGSLIGSYVSLDGLKVFLRNMSVSNSTTDNLIRDRALLLHKFEIKKIKQKIEEKGLTVIPLEVFLENNLIKVSVGVCRGKKLHEKKGILKEKDIKREMEREISHMRA